MITTTFDVRNALAALDGIRAEVADKALVRALNKTADQAKVQASRAIRDAGYKIKAGTIKASITIARATATTLTASVIAKGKRIPLVEYTARPVNPGVTVAVKEGRKLVRSVFFATMPTGHRGVYERDTRRGSGRVPFVRDGKRNTLRGPERVPYQRNGKRNNKQLPIRELDGPSIPQAFVNATVQDALLTGVRERFPVILARELAYVLSKTK